MLKNGYAKQMFPDLFKEQVEPKWATIEVDGNKALPSYWSDGFIEAESKLLGRLAVTGHRIINQLTDSGIPKSVAEGVANELLHKLLNPPMTK